MAYKTSSLHYGSEISAKVTGTFDDHMAIKLEFRVAEWFEEGDNAFNLAVDAWYFSVDEAKEIIATLSEAVAKLNPPSLPEVPTVPEMDTPAPADPLAGVVESDYDKHALDDLPQQRTS